MAAMLASPCMSNVRARVGQYASKDASCGLDTDAPLLYLAVNSQSSTHTDTDTEMNTHTHTKLDTESPMVVSPRR